MSQAHSFQSKMCERAVDNGNIPILNAACKEDPANLGRDYNAVNFDITDFDPHTNTKLPDLKNFVQGNLLEANTLFEPKFFGMVVLGEFLEHCVYDAAVKALQEIHKILEDRGFLTITLPLDGRPKNVQHAKHHLVVTFPGMTGHDITVWHQTVWEDEMLEKLFEESGWKETSRTNLHYGFCAERGGWGLTLEKR